MSNNYKVHNSDTEHPEIKRVFETFCNEINTIAVSEDDPISGASPWTKEVLKLYKPDYYRPNSRERCWDWITKRWGEHNGKLVFWVSIFFLVVGIFIYNVAPRLTHNFTIKGEANTIIVTGHIENGEEHQNSTYTITHNESNDTVELEGKFISEDSTQLAFKIENIVINSDDIGKVNISGTNIMFTDKSSQSMRTITGTIDSISIEISSEP